MRFRVLGQVEISSGKSSVRISRPKVAQVVSVLLARGNKLVTADVLIEELWGQNVPRSALTTIQTYVYHLRKMIEQNLGIQSSSDILITETSGYSIIVGDGALDADVFASMVVEGRRHFVAGNAEGASACLSAALDLWRGPVFTGVPLGTVLNGHAMYLNELRLSAVALFIEARQALGRHGELIPELRLLVSENPLNEKFHGYLIGSLCECGRRAEALEAYQNLWHTLDKELGLQPTAELSMLHQTILNERTRSR